MSIEQILMKVSGGSAVETVSVGTKGESGAPGTSWAGLWDEERVYYLNEGVRYGNDWFRAKRAVEAGVAPEDGDDWELLFEGQYLADLQAAAEANATAAANSAVAAAGSATAAGNSAIAAAGSETAAAASAASAQDYYEDIAGLGLLLWGDESGTLGLWGDEA